MKKMKKVFLVIALGLAPFLVHGQGPISFGPKIGWNSDRLTTDYTRYMQDIKSGGQGGLFLSIYLNRFYIQPEVYLRLQSSFHDPANPNSSFSLSQTINLHSVDIPVLLGFKFLDLKLIRFRVWAGPVASYVLNKNYTLSLNGLNQSERITRDDFKDAFWSAQVGAGIDLLMLTFDVGYEFGLDNFLTIHSLDNFGFRNNLFYCSIGWRLF
jgi:hypothetical protein